MIKLSDHYKGEAFFSCYRDGNLWYVTEKGFEFPIPVSDLQGTQVKSVEKAIFLLRWMRRHADIINEAANENICDSRRTSQTGE